MTSFALNRRRLLGTALSAGALATLSFAAVVVISAMGVLMFSAVSLVESKVVFQREEAK